MAVDLPPEMKVEIFEHGLRSLLEAALRKRLEQTVKEVLDAAIHDAMDGLQAAIERESDLYNRQDIVRVILEDRREGSDADPS